MADHDDNRPRWPFPEHGKLTAHPKRQWCKWLDGKTQYFGPWRKLLAHTVAVFLNQRQGHPPLQLDLLIDP
jgi:hypothetical protein